MFLDRNPILLTNNLFFEIHPLRDLHQYISLMKTYHSAISYHFITLADRYFIHLYKSFIHSKSPSVSFNLNGKRL